MNERMIDIKKKELLNALWNSHQVFDVDMVWNEAWKAACKASIDITIKILCKELPDDVSELTYIEIQNQLHKELG